MSKCPKCRGTGNQGHPDLYEECTKCASYRSVERQAFEEWADAQGWDKSGPFRRQMFTAWNARANLTERIDAKASTGAESEAKAHDSASLVLNIDALEHAIDMLEDIELSMQSARRAIIAIRDQNG